MLSSRSSASEPATRSRVTKVRVRVAATAIAKTSSGGVAALTDCLSTAIGWARRSISGARSRGCRGQPAEPDHPVELRARCAGGSRGRSGPRIAAAAPQPEYFDRPAEHFEVAAVDHQVEVRPPSLEIRREMNRLASATSARDPVVDHARLDRVLLVDDHLDFRLFGVQAGERLEPVDQVRGQDQRRDTSPASTFASASSRVATSTHSTCGQTARRGRRAGELAAAAGDPGVLAGLR